MREGWYWDPGCNSRRLEAVTVTITTKPHFNDNMHGLRLAREARTDTSVSLQVRIKNNNMRHRVAKSKGGKGQGRTNERSEGGVFGGGWAQSKSQAPKLREEEEGGRNRRRWRRKEKEDSGADRRGSPRPCGKLGLHLK
mmetsp:Transcript_12870/g.28178  ORF Transcript_12870/g.28178 Transcript_12870/m.28178 type:complete len:139 (-) Transcript_12870:2583-2999(-)